LSDDFDHLSGFPPLGMFFLPWTDHNLPTLLKFSPSSEV
jgi:hypothetical protein